LRWLKQFLASSVSDDQNTGIVAKAGRKGSAPKGLIDFNICPYQQPNSFDQTIFLKKDVGNH
jgi:hypothetical protein